MTISDLAATTPEDRDMNNFDPTQMFAAFQPQQAFTTAAGYAKSMLTELEKQAQRWSEYGVAQSTEMQKLFHQFQGQAFSVGKSALDASEKAFNKAGA